MLTNLFAGSFLALGLLFAAAEPRDCCDAKLACCTPKSACCMADAEAKERGDTGCGCATVAPPKEHAQAAACCGVVA